MVKAGARLIFRGFSQGEGLISLGLMPPSRLRLVYIRLLASIACEHYFDLFHFEAEQAFVQSELDEESFLRLLHDCGTISGRAVPLNRRLCGLRQESRTWRNHLIVRMESLGFERIIRFALAEEGSMSVIEVVLVDDIFNVGRSRRCGLFDVNFNCLVSVDSLGELCLYAGCHFSRDRIINDLLTIL